MSLQQLLQMGRGYQMPQMQQPMTRMQPMGQPQPMMQQPMDSQPMVPRFGPGSVAPTVQAPPQPGGGLAEFLARSRRTHNAPPVRTPMQPLMPVAGGPLMPGAR